MAIDRDYLAEKVWQNTMIPAYSFVPPGISGYETQDHGLRRECRRSTARTRPRRSSTELGYGPDKPLKMEIRYNTSENHKNTAVAIQEQLKPLGIEVTLLNTDTKTHYGHLEQHGDFDVARAGWIADYKDPENFLALCKTGTGNNYARLCQPGIRRPDGEGRRRRGRRRAHEAALARPRRSAWRATSASCRCSTTATTIVVSEQAQGLGGQRHGRPSHPLPEQGIILNAIGPLLPSNARGGPVLARRLSAHAALCPPAVSDRDPDALRDRDDLLLPDARGARRTLQPGEGPQSRHQGQSRARLSISTSRSGSNTCSICNNLLHGDFGPSYNLPDFTVAELFAQGLPVSMQLGGSALVLALLVGGCSASSPRSTRTSRPTMR